jgi:hypothetical protein
VIQGRGAGAPPGGLLGKKRRGVAADPCECCAYSIIFAVVRRIGGPYFGCLSSDEHPLADVFCSGARSLSGLRSALLTSSTPKPWKSSTDPRLLRHPIFLTGTRRICLDHQLTIRKSCASACLQPIPLMHALPMIPGRIPKSIGRVSKSPGRASKSPGKVSKSSARTSKSPGRVSKSSGRTSKSPGRVSKSSGWVSKSPGRASKSPGRASKSPGRVPKWPGRSLQPFVRPPRCRRHTRTQPRRATPSPVTSDLRPPTSEPNPPPGPKKQTKKKQNTNHEKRIRQPPEHVPDHPRAA